MSFNDLLDEIKSNNYSFIGSYNVNNFSTNPNKNTSSNSCNISSNIENYNFLSVRFFYYNEFKNPNKNIQKIMELGETYNITSFSVPEKDINLKSQINGFISFGGVYPDTIDQSKMNGITNRDFVKFGASNTTGIYKDIKYVIIDFRETIRKIYFFK